MIGDLSNHLWQSTLFVVFAALVAAALRKNGAHIRYVVWLTASLKFFVPFALLMSLGSQWAWTRPAEPGVEAPAMESMSVVMDQIAQPFTPAVPSAPIASRSMIDWMPAALIALWAFGFAAVLLMRLHGWARVRAAIRASVPLTIHGVDVPSSIDIRASAGLLEPGIVGLWRPILLVPAGIETRLTSIQLEAVLAHELCHIRRRDNVTAAMHMVVEAIFWFHPLVWWIGARMVDERERACDEHVLRELGKPEAYAEGILNVCKLYVESPLTCVSGVTGSNLKRRIEAIMVNRIGLQLNFARKIAIAVAAVLALAAPIVVGMITAPIRAFGQTAGAERFEVVSIKPCQSAAAPAGRNGGAPWHAQTSPGRVYWDCVMLPTLVDQAYADEAHPLVNAAGDSRPPRTDFPLPKRVRGGPDWVEADRFTIEVKASVGATGTATKNLATLPPKLGEALRAALEDRFRLKAHRATEQQNMYALRVAGNGLNQNRVRPTKPGDCVTMAEFSAAEPMTQRSLKICGRNFVTAGAREFAGVTLKQLADTLSGLLDRSVLDETGIDGTFNFAFQYEPGDGTPAGNADRNISALSDLGLKVQGTKGTAEYIVIDSAEKPTPNEAFALSIPDETIKVPAAQKPKVAALNRFEVASVKPCDPSTAVSAGRGGGIGPNYESSPGRVMVNCVNAAYLTLRAFIMNGNQNPDDPINAWANEASLSDPQNRP